MSQLIQLDDMLKTEDAAKWLQMAPEELLKKSRGGKRAKIPAFWFNERVARWNPRTVIAKLAADNGVSPEVVSAMFNLNVGK